MRLGLLSDIHGNAEALAVVLAAARAEGVERILFAGDAVGYYYEPARCLALLSEWPMTPVRGNHEDMLQGVIAQPSLADGIHQRYGSGLATALKTLTPAQLAELTAWPVQRQLDIEGSSILLCHGAPWDTNQYVYPDASEELLARCRVDGCDFVVMGHTHYRFSVQAGATRLLNPGSVGQPRDRRPGAAWGLLDTASGDYQQRTELYDTERVARQARSIDPHLPYLWEVLTRQ